MMKLSNLKKIFMGLVGVAILAACSNDIPADGGDDSSTATLGENFMSVAIELPASGSRATQDGFDDGTTDESKIDNIVFFFFDEAGNRIEMQMEENPKFEDPAKPSLNPNITNYGIIEIRLKSGLKYSKIGVALNSPTANANLLKSQINTISDYLSRTYDYVQAVKSDGSGQLMSNSIYFDMENSTQVPVESKRVDVIPITDENIYSASQRNDIDNLIQRGEKKYVNIFVERALAKVVVEKPKFNMDDYYVADDNNTKIKTITLFDHVNGTSRDIVVRPEIEGMVLNVLAPKTALVKPLNIDEVGYDQNATDYKAFQWNDPANKRSYWASTAFLSEPSMKYLSWNQASERGDSKFTQYIHPNTQDFKPITANEGRSLNTKVMVSATLYEYKDGEKQEKPLDLVMFGADYLLADDFKAHVANLINRDIRNIEWTNALINVENVTLTDDQLTAINSCVNNAYTAENGYKADDFKLDIAEYTPEDEFGIEDWIASVFTKDGVQKPQITGYPEVNGVDELNSYVQKVIDATKQATLDRINTNRIMYWKEGRTYFYTIIRHQGFNGLVGNGTSDFLYGVVRNHVYNITLTGVYGLGTPVINPKKPIHPQHPNDGRPSYIKAKINILPWRIVTNNATIH